MKSRTARKKNNRLAKSTDTAGADPMMGGTPCGVGVCESADTVIVDVRLSEPLSTNRVYVCKQRAVQLRLVQESILV